MKRMISSVEVGCSFYPHSGTTKFDAFVHRIEGSEEKVSSWFENISAHQVNRLRLLQDALCKKYKAEEKTYASRYSGSSR